MQDFFADLSGVGKRVVFQQGGFGRCPPPLNENRNEGTFGCSLGTKTRTRVRSHVPPERKPERGYIRQNHPKLQNRPFISSCESLYNRGLQNIYHHHPESKKRKSSEGNSGSIHPYGRYGNAGKTSKTISTIAILWPVKAIFEKRAATVEVDNFISPV